MKLYWIITALLAGIFSAIAAPPSFSHFITARDGTLHDGNSEFRFLSFDVPNLLEIEDNVAFTNLNPWRLPDKFEITDALETLHALGGTVARTYVVTVKRTNDAPDLPRHVVAPGKFDEESFRPFDEVLAAANQAQVRLIIPLVDNWPWMGGRAEYARWRGKAPDDFWTDPRLIADFEQTIRFVLTRTNTITGSRYCDDKAILCWETGNELSSPPAWTREIAHFIKSLDTNHLVMDGFNTPVLREESLDISDVDIVTTHHYPGEGKSFAQLIRANAARAHGRKAYIIGEFGFAPTSQMIAAMDAITDSGASGGLLWSLRFRNRDGGFYWHTEPFGGNLYKAFHWPASVFGEPYDEAKLLAAVREKAFAIRGLPVPNLPSPAPPKLLPIADVAAISWQGSVGASSYEVERAPKKSGPWEIIATNLDEAFTQYRPEFADEGARSGNWLYRVRARNGSGISKPSNTQSAWVKNLTLVDELADFSKVHSHGGSWTLANRDCRSAKEDAHRAAGSLGDELVYALSSPIVSFRVFAFFPKVAGEVKFYTSQDGNSFHEIAAQEHTYFQGSGDYDYWLPALFYAEGIRGDRFLKIRPAAEIQIGRVEIVHTALPQ